ncbi:HNH endonuclease signature motif containing protein [Peribacillus simplex]|uniref:HNH endonuclease signature motif containing protein n=1 Tax=Peribacillus simplex TaxID=1478 RepID=UPI00399CA1D4
MCVNCGIDLSVYLSLDNKENYDHIVTLNLYGFNDVSNIQLLCRKCNSEKVVTKAYRQLNIKDGYEI